MGGWNECHGAVNEPHLCGVFARLHSLDVVARAVRAVIFGALTHFFATSLQHPNCRLAHFGQEHLRAGHDDFFAGLEVRRNKPALAGRAS